MLIENLDLKKSEIRNYILYCGTDIFAWTNRHEQRKNNTIIYSGFILYSATARQLYCIKCLQ